MSGWVAGAIVVGAVVGAYSASESGKAQSAALEKASQSEAAASAYATDVQRQQYEQTREDQEPWRVAGTQALQAIQDTPDFEFTAEDFTNFQDPSYDFRMQEGVNALDRSAASRGRLLSGAQDRAVTRYGSDLASQEYGNAFNRSLTEYNVNLAKQQGLAGIGQSATNVVSSAGQTTASNIGNIATQSGQTQANLAVQEGNALATSYSGIAQSANQGIGNYLLYQESQ